MTGILPIKKDGTESAISDFREYTIINSGKLSEYTGFLGDEVEELCNKHNMSFSKMKEWYDGYRVNNKSIYNPYSVILAIDNECFDSYWKKTTAVEALFTYVDLNYEGLQDDILRLIAGEDIEVDTTVFANDMTNFKNKDDVLTLLVHLGYLTYDNEKKTARIPNREILGEFKNIIKTPGMNKLAVLVNRSEELLRRTMAGDADYVCKIIEDIRKSDYAPTFYNNEQALRYVIKFAYITCVDKYLQIQEMPSGKGVADVVFFKRKTHCILPWWLNLSGIRQIQPLLTR